MQILALYQKKFPRVFSVLNANPTDRVFDMHDMLPPAPAPAPASADSHGHGHGKEGTRQ